MRTGTVSYKLEDLRKGVIIPIGMVGENDFTRVIFDAEEVFKKHPDAQVTMKVQPPKGGIYPATVTRDGNTVIWQVKAEDVAHKGSGELQLTFTADTMVEKSYIARTDIKRSLVGNGPAPDPVQDWLDEAQEALEDIESAEVHQPIIGTDGYWYKWNQETGEYEKTDTKAQGADGQPGRDGTDATPDLITKDYADLTFPVAEGTYCYHSGMLYYAKQDIQTSEAWTAEHWQQTTVEEQQRLLLNAIQGIEALLDERTIYPTINLYNPALQTNETISPHYYVNGVPYSTAQFDTAWNCTAPIPVKSSTKYALGLIPSVGENQIVKPWNTAAYGWFAYDSNNNFLGGGAGNIFTTPENAAYLRFNYYIALNTVSLDVLNARCVLVEGESLPAGYIPYGDVTIKEKIDTCISAKINYIIGQDGTSVTLITKYNDQYDLAVTLAKKGGNNLFDFYKIGIIANPTKNISTTSESQVILLQTDTDWFAPFVVKAVNNIDGDSIASDTFTGGNHQYNNTGGGSTPTARGTALLFKADNIAVTSGNGSCSVFEMDWTNLVQGTNTKKADGTGREILQENHRLIFDGIKFEAFTDLIPLENVKMLTWYGMQWTYSYNYVPIYGNVRYVGATNRGEYDCTNESTKSGDNKCCHVVANGDMHELRLDIDEGYDIGDHRFYQSGDSAMFTATYGKGYCNFFNITDLYEDMIYSLHGWYQFRSRT